MGKRTQTIYDRLRWAYGQRLSLSQKAVLTNLVSHANARGEAWPELRTIADEISASTTTVSNAIGHLETIGLIEVTRRGGMGSGKGRGRGSNRYLLHYERPSPDSTRLNQDIGKAPRPDSARLNQDEGQSISPDSASLNQDDHDLIQFNAPTDSTTLYRSNHESLLPIEVTTERGVDGGPESLKSFLGNGGRLDD